MVGWLYIRHGSAPPPLFFAYPDGVREVCVQCRTSKTQAVLRRYRVKQFLSYGGTAVRNRYAHRNDTSSTARVTSHTATEYSV